MQPSVVVSPKGEQRLRGGHLWVYRSDLADVRAERGDVVAVTARNGRLVGRAIYSDRSQIAIRLLTRDDRAVDEGFWRERLEAAIAFRRRLAIDATAYRLVHAEGDLLPSLVVDRYGEVLVVQALSQGIDRALPAIVAALVELCAPSGILARHDARARELEGLERKVEVLHGEVPATIVVREGAVELEVDPWKGQKTGLFLDQRENHAAARAFASGRLLDCFSYAGGFALQLARGTSKALAIDISEETVARLARNAARNGIANVEARVANAFDFLREAERRGDRFDTIVLDPPAFARTRASLPKALAGYKELNLRALRILAPGGALATCSCSYHVGEELFARMLEDAAADAHATMSVIERRGQSRDHPVLLGVPETGYLKCFVLRKLG
ncbi:MAG: class I SAM-dependent rRNA methyltransferase [Candidatus Binatia bacterium]